MRRLDAAFDFDLDAWIDPRPLAAALSRSGRGDNSHAIEIMLEDISDSTRGIRAMVRAYDRCLRKATPSTMKQLFV
jgi:hypothetical protein